MHVIPLTKINKKYPSELELRLFRKSLDKLLRKTHIKGTDDMNKSDLKIIYEKLTVAWQYECNSKSICKLTDPELTSFMNCLKEVHKQTNELSPKSSTEIEKRIINKIRVNAGKNADFLLNDLLDLRQEKIIDSCRKLDIIDFDLLTSAEKEFYNKIMPSFKGYRKMRNMYSVLSDSCSSETQTDNAPNYCITNEFEIDHNKPAKEVEYILMRTLDSIPALVGYDSVVYGPFKKEEMGVIPKINASILAKERLIEIIS